MVFSDVNTLLLGMLINCIITGKHPAQDLFFISFNVCIRNELRRKLRVYGFIQKRQKFVLLTLLFMKFVKIININI